MTRCNDGEADMRLTPLRFCCRSQREIVETLRSKGMKVVRFSGIPGAWRCLVQAPRGRSIHKGEVRVSSYFPGRIVTHAYDGPTVIGREGEPGHRCSDSWLTLILQWLAVMFGFRKYRNLTNDMSKISFSSSKMGNKLLEALAALALAAALVSSDAANAATMTVNAPSYTGAEYNLDVSFTNNDNGVIYSTASTDVISSLAQDIYALGNSTQASVADMITNELGISIRGAPAGEVQSGWDGNVAGVSSVEFTHAPFGYTSWQNTSSNSSQDTMAVRFVVPDYLLDTDGTAGYNALTDHTIRINPVAQNDMFVGNEDAFNSYSASGNAYQLQGVPEPSSSALVGLGLGALAFRRNRKD